MRRLCSTIIVRELLWLSVDLTAQKEIFDQKSRVKIDFPSLGLNFYVAGNHRGLSTGVY